MYNKLFIASILATKASAALLPPQLGSIHVRDDTYNCHANCGYAILEIDASDDVCTDETFLTDYANCLICSGEDNDDIWEWYGDSLTAAAASCGLATTPATGSQADVGTAIIAESAAATAAATTAASAAATTTSTSEAVVSSTSASASAAATVSSAATSTASTVATSTVATSVSGTGSASGTGAVTSSSATSVVTAGAAAHPVAAGLLGAAALAAFAAVY